MQLMPGGSAHRLTSRFLQIGLLVSLISFGCQSIRNSNGVVISQESSLGNFMYGRRGYQSVELKFPSVRLDHSRRYIWAIDGAPAIEYGVGTVVAAEIGPTGADEAVWSLTLLAGPDEASAMPIYHYPLAGGPSPPGWGSFAIKSQHYVVIAELTVAAPSRKPPTLQILASGVIDSTHGSASAAAATTKP